MVSCNTTNIHKDVFHCHSIKIKTPHFGSYLFLTSGKTINSKKELTKMFLYLGYLFFAMSLCVISTASNLGIIIHFHESCSELLNMKHVASHIWLRNMTWMFLKAIIFVEIQGFQLSFWDLQFISDIMDWENFWSDPSE